MRTHERALDRPRSHRQCGFSFVEVAFGLLIMVIAAAVLVNHLSVNYQTTLTERDRVFAYTKAQAILAAIQSEVDRAGPEHPIDLAATFDDGALSKPELTIARDGNGLPVAPDHVLSGNVLRGEQWLWSRRVSVKPLQGVQNRNVRYVTVRILRRNLEGVEVPVADLSTVVNAAGTGSSPTQVFDVFLIAIANIPGWWQPTDSIPPHVESVISDLEARNPGMEVRTHWITRSSFGRNPVYRPSLNELADTLAPIGVVYHYPGTLPAGSPTPGYYSPTYLKGRIAIDGLERNGWHETENPYPYSFADVHNHAMRLPEERALWQQRVAAIERREAEILRAKVSGSVPPDPLPDMSKAPTLRLLLEDMYSRPQDYRNAILVNMHGELLPMPPLRNYSDAARDPEHHPEVRVVTHPEELRTLRQSGSSSSPLRLRVYAHNTHMLRYTGPAVLPDPIAVEVVGVDLTNSSTAAPDLHPDVQIQNLRGGVPVNGSSDYFPFAAAKVQGDPSLVAGEMFYSAQFVSPGPDQEKYTRILLHNTPVVAPPDADDANNAMVRGLFANERSQLHWMPYVPGPVEVARDFSRNLHTPGDGPKNTARWTIALSGSLLARNVWKRVDGSSYTPAGDMQVTVRTRIWSGISPERNGTMWPPALRCQPENLSVTHAWWADSAEDVPITERWQFQGDPRHNPYRDLLNGDPDFPNGYNWYFDTLVTNGENATVDFPGIDGTRLRRGWRSVNQSDVPRFMHLLRSALTRSRSVFHSVTGFSFSYLGLGGEVGADATMGYPNSIPMDLTPYGQADVDGHVNTVTGPRVVARQGGASNHWIAMPWLGEISPDATHRTQWLAPDAAGEPLGNLVAGTGSSNCFLQAAATAYASAGRQAWGTTLANGTAQTGNEGCTSFFNIGSASSTFHFNIVSGGTGQMTASGRHVADGFNVRMPLSGSVRRPFALATSSLGTVGDEFALSPYATSRHTASLLRTYWTSSSAGRVGSGIVKLLGPGGTDAAYVSVHGFDRLLGSSQQTTTRWILMTALDAFAAAGNSGNPHRIDQLPRIEIMDPDSSAEFENPAAIVVKWDVDWRRWDGKPYSENVEYTGDESSLRYVLSYSRDGGTTWQHVQDNSPADPGSLPSPGLIVADSGEGEEAFTWSLSSSSFPAGTYQLRIDCFREGMPLHYSYHVATFFVTR